MKAEEYFKERFEIKGNEYHILLKLNSQNINDILIYDEILRFNAKKCVLWDRQNL